MVFIYVYIYNFFFLHVSNGRKEGVHTEPKKIKYFFRCCARFNWSLLSLPSDTIISALLRCYTVITIPCLLITVPPDIIVDSDRERERERTASYRAVRCELRIVVGHA